MIFLCTPGYLVESLVNFNDEKWAMRGYDIKSYTYNTYVFIFKVNKRVSMNYYTESAKIKEGAFAIVRKVGGEHIRLCRLISGQRVLIERLSFDPKNAIGHFYGTFEVSGGGNRICPVGYTSKTIKIEEIAEHLRSEKDGNQQLTSNQIMTLKEDGITTNELVTKLISGNCHFQFRTKFSKEKYMRKKVQRHSDRVMILQPNIRLMSDCYYRKDPERLGHLRIDQLGLILQLSGLHSGKCNAFVFDQVLGLLGAAVLERIDSAGHCIFLHRGDWSQSIPCLDLFTSNKRCDGFLPLRITTLLKSDNKQDEEVTDNNRKSGDEGDTTRLVKREDDDGEQKRREQQMQKKAEREEKERRAMKILKSATEQEGKVDSICMAIRSVDPVDILEKIFGALRLSGTVVIYSPVKQHLLSAWKWLRSVGSAVDIHLSQHFFRSQQVIHDRTHPMMQQLISGGYVLHAVKVLPPESEQTQQRALNKELLAKHSRIGL